MNWKFEAIEKLKQYEAKKLSLQTIPEEIARLEYAMAGIRSATAYERIEDVCDMLEECPTVDAVEVVHGYWVTTPFRKLNRNGKVVNYCDYHHCSECGTDRPIVPPYNYCPNCGAKMDGDGRTDGND